MTGDEFLCKLTILRFWRTLLHGLSYLVLMSTHMRVFQGCVTLKFNDRYF